MSGALKVFEGLMQFAEFLEARPAVMIPTGQLVVGESARILAQEVRKGYGDHLLPELAEATQADRVAKGYSPDDPLLRDGALLRDSTEMRVGPDVAAAGTSEPIAGYHEFGYWNVRAQKFVVARAVYKYALERSAAGVVKLIEGALGIQLGFATSLPTLSSAIESGTASYLTEAIQKE